MKDLESEISKETGSSSNNTSAGSKAEIKHTSTNDQENIDEKEVGANAIAQANPDRTRLTALGCAISNGKIDIVKYLIDEKEVDANATSQVNPDGSSLTALEFVFCANLHDIETKKKWSKLCFLTELIQILVPPFLIRINS